MAVLRSALQSASVEVRVQGAAGSRNLEKDAAEELLLIALRDPDPSIRTIALKTVDKAFGTAEQPDTVRQIITGISLSDPEVSIRERAARASEPT